MSGLTVSPAHCAQPLALSIFPARLLSGGSEWSLTGCPEAGTVLTSGQVGRDTEPAGGHQQLLPSRPQGGGGQCFQRPFTDAPTEVQGPLPRASTRLWSGEGPSPAPPFPASGPGRAGCRRQQARWALLLPILSLHRHGRARHSSMWPCQRRGCQLGDQSLKSTPNPLPRKGRGWGASQSPEVPGAQDSGEVCQAARPALAFLLPGAMQANGAASHDFGPACARRGCWAVSPASPPPAAGVPPLRATGRGVQRSGCACHTRFMVNF